MTDADGTRATALSELRAEITACTACPRLVAWRQQAAANPPRAFAAEEYWSKALSGFGDLGARLVVVGLAPAAHGGNRTGRMFTGDRSGDFLFAALWRAGFANQAGSRRRDDGLELRDAYVTAAVRCAPPGNKPAPEERDRCRRYLTRELSLLEGAGVYLALGAFAYEAISRTPPVAGALPAHRPRFSHGCEIGLSTPGRPRWLLCSYHPSQRNVFTGLLTPEMFDGVLARARQLLSSS
ncbi:MAG TPA: uracil-DNA glycosylase [Acidimicrobiales bacterium]|nr:uracil-DNA glycosylase [Acidimicrobiales bacterium]